MNMAYVALNTQAKLFPEAVDEPAAAQPLPPVLPTLAELARAARLGDARASDALWRRCTALAMQLARRWATNSIDAEDLSQEALLRAVESFSALREPMALLSWLHVVVWRSISYEARLVRRETRLLSGGSDPEALLSRQASPDLQVDVWRLLDLVEGLPEEERRCLWLRRGEGLRIEEIAKETSLSPSTVQRRLHVAEARLHKRLKG